MIEGMYQDIVNRLDKLPGELSALPQQIATLTTQVGALTAENAALKALAKTTDANQADTLSALDARLKAIEALVPTTPAATATPTLVAMPDPTLQPVNGALPASLNGEVLQTNAPA